MNVYASVRGSETPVCVAVLPKDTGFPTKAHRDRARKALTAFAETLHETGGLPIRFGDECLHCGVLLPSDSLCTNPRCNHSFPPVKAINQLCALHRPLPEEEGQDYLQRLARIWRQTPNG